MKRLLLFAILGLSVAATFGCGSTNQFGSRCRLFTGYRGAPCNVCEPNPCACPAPNPCGCGTPVYSQSIPMYGGDCGCSGVPGYSGMPGYYGGDMGYGVSGDCCGGNGGIQYAPGMVIPGQGVIVDGAGQIPSLPGGTLSPQTVPAPQTTPIPQATPGPAAGN